LEWLRPFTIFYHYQPQFMISQGDWYTNSTAWLHLCVLVGIGAVGYVGAWISFCRRDLPAPL
jgi:hypothetical protein